jgi:hypothetical protein
LRWAPLLCLFSSSPSFSLSFILFLAQFSAL